MNRKFLRNSSWLIALLAALVVMTACQENNSTEPEEQAPELPPESSFLPDFSSFDTTTVALRGNNPAVILDSTKVNWLHAALHVGFWDAVLYIQLVVPSAAFQAAFLHQPQFQGNATWLWEYTVRPLGGLGVPHEVALQGKVVGNGVEWEMRLSKENEFEDFLWVTGFSRFGNTGGEWLVNYKPDDSTPFIQVDWNRDTGNGTYDIRFEYLLPGTAEEGTYLDFNYTNDVPYNMIGEIYRAPTDRTININWNRDTSAGQVKNPFAFGDSAYHCWNENHEDIDCP